MSNLTEKRGAGNVSFFFISPHTRFAVNELRLIKRVDRRVFILIFTLFCRRGFIKWDFRASEITAMCRYDGSRVCKYLYWTQTEGLKLAIQKDRISINIYLHYKAARVWISIEILTHDFIRIYILIVNDRCSMNCYTQ